MSKEQGPVKYDNDLQMFVVAPQELDMRRIVFMRWLAERERLEHSVCGKPSGEACALALTQGAL